MRRVQIKTEAKMAVKGGTAMVQFMEHVTLPFKDAAAEQLKVWALQQQQQQQQHRVSAAGGATPTPRSCLLYTSPSPRDS